MAKVEITARSEGGYAVTSSTGPRFLLVNLAWLDALVQALYDQRMLSVNGEVKPPARRQ